MKLKPEAAAGLPSQFGLMMYVLGFGLQITGELKTIRQGKHAGVSSFLLSEGLQLCRHAAECYEKLSESPPEWSDGTSLVFVCEESVAALAQRYCLCWLVLPSSRIASCEPIQVRRHGASSGYARW